MKKLLPFLLFTLLSITIYSQDSPPEIVEIVTKDGNSIVGEIISESETTYVIKSSSLGELTIQKINILSLKPKGANRNNRSEIGEPFIDYHNSTRYLLSPSGYGLKKGQAYYENIGIFFNSFALGVTDNFSIAAGGEIASLLFAQRVPILYVSPKFSFEFNENKGAWSVGSTFFTSPSDDFEGFGVVNTSFTLGDRTNNFTIGGGFGFSTSGGFSDEVFPLFASFMVKMSEKTSLVSDNFIILYNNSSDATGVISFALQLKFKKKGAAMNFGLWRPTEDVSDLIAFPFVSATIPLGI